MKIVFVLANSVCSVEVPYYIYVAFHLGLHCLPKYIYESPVYKGLSDGKTKQKHFCEVVTILY